MGEAGVTVRAEKDGVNDFDHRIRPPMNKLIDSQTGIQAYSYEILIRDLAFYIAISSNSKQVSK
jgi:hypothetical protein